MIAWDPRALWVVEQLQQAGHQAALVGGCVRDSLLSIQPHDYDVATSALPHQVAQLFPQLPCIPTGAKHGTLTLLSQGLGVEVTTFRREGTYSDHRHPDQVAFTPLLEEDLARRDFTINAMAWDGHTLVDLHGGRQDLARGVIRCVGDAELRLEEDALRLLRGLRLAAQLNFSIDSATASAIRSHTPQLSHVAWERISAELLRLLCAPGAGAVLLAFPATMGQIIPELSLCIGFDQRSPHHRYDVYTHCVKTLEGVPPTPVLRLGALLHDVGKPDCFCVDGQGVGHFYGHPKHSVQRAARALARLQLDRNTQQRVLDLIARHDLSVLPTRQWAGRWLARLGQELFFQLMELKWADRLACGVEPQETGDLGEALACARALLADGHCLTLADLQVNGHDAMAAGLSGPAVGQALRTLLALVAQGALPNLRPCLVDWLKQYKTGEA